MLPTIARSLCEQKRAIQSSFDLRRNPCCVNAWMLAKSDALRTLLLWNWCSTVQAAFVARVLVRESCLRTAALPYAVRTAGPAYSLVEMPDDHALCAARGSSLFVGLAFLAVTLPANRFPCLSACATNWQVGGGQKSWRW